MKTKNYDRLLNTIKNLIDTDVEEGKYPDYDKIVDDTIGYSNRDNLYTYFEKVYLQSDSGDDWDKEDCHEVGTSIRQTYST
tara:strand:+ start:93 stop:335 length:243 start_codon:yes stop_codon:yes gene_type:complete